MRIIFHSILILLCFHLSFQEISIIRNNTIVISFQEVDHLANPNHPIMFMAPLFNGFDNCHQFPSIPSSFAPKNYTFLLLFPSRSCSTNFQISRAQAKGYNAFLYVDDSSIPFLENEITNQNEPYFLLIVVNEEQARVLSKIAYPNKFYVLYKEIPDTSFSKIMPLVAVSVGIGVVLFCLASFHLFKYLLKIIRTYRKRNRIFKIPCRRCIEDDILEPCSICLDNYAVNDMITVLPCRHEFHQSCLRKWDGDNCPLCRAVIYKLQENEFSSITNLTSSSPSQEFQISFTQNQVRHINAVEDDDQAMLIPHRREASLLSEWVEV